MNKTELVKRVTEKLEGVPQKIAAKAVDAVFESIQRDWKRTVSSRSANGEHIP
jgi:nucleoid DNA-binding protein